MRRFGDVLWGIVLVVIGVILALNVAGITHINLFFKGWWTLFIIIPCFIGLFKEREKTWNVIGLLLGIALLLCSYGVIHLQLIIKLAFPTILIIIGVSLLFRDVIQGAVNKKIKELNKEGLEEYCSTFSAQKVSVNGTEFKGANINAIFGGVDLDLSNVQIDSDKIINVSTIFGGSDIWVPQNVNVKVKSTSIFGGVDDKYRRTKNESLPTIYINAFCLFGGVEIK